VWEERVKRKRVWVKWIWDHLVAYCKCILNNTPETLSHPSPIPHPFITSSFFLSYLLYISLLYLNPSIAHLPYHSIPTIHLQTCKAFNYSCINYVSCSCSLCSTLSFSFSLMIIYWSSTINSVPLNLYLSLKTNRIPPHIPW